MFLEVLDKHATIQNKKLRSKNLSWITSKIKDLIRTRDRKQETDSFNYKVQTSYEQSNY